MSNATRSRRAAGTQRAPQLQPVGETDQTAGQRAAEVWLEAAARGQLLSGRELAEEAGIGERWARDVIRPLREMLDLEAAAGNLGPAAVDAEAAAGLESSAADDAVAAAALPALGEPVVPAAAVRQPGPSWSDGLITLVVAVVAAAASYGHMLEVALLAGEPMWIARAFPITVDGLVLAALRRGKAGRFWLGLGIAVSVAANVLGQFPELAATVGPAVSAWPPVALFGTHRLLHHQPLRDR